MKIDLHVHSCYSRDGLSTPKSIIKKIKQKKIDGIAITDHDNCKAWGELSRLAKEEGLLVIKGEEIKIRQDGKTVGELSGLFMNAEVLPGSFGEVVDALAVQDAFAVIQHPFDWFRKPFKDLDNGIKRVNALEVFNSRCILGSMNSKALRYATEHNLIQVAGSDAHTPWEIGNAFIECNCTDEEELRKAILKRKTKFVGRLSSPLFHFFSPLAKNGLVKKL